MGLNDKAVITVALSGVVANRSQCPGIPYTPEEYAAEARRSYDNGCTMVHIHAREPDGTPTHRVGAYKDIRDAILSECPDMIINFSTGSVGIPVEERIAHIRELKPDIGALNMGSMNYAKYSSKRKEFVFDLVFQNPFSDILKFLAVMNEVGVKPELESFDSGHIGNSYPLIDMGALKTPVHYSLILGVVGVSHDQWRLAAAAATLGGNVRVGFEDNFYLPNGEMAPSNGDLARAAGDIIRSTGRDVATAAEARQIVGLTPRT